MNTRQKIVFLWHWQKRLTSDEAGVKIAVEDTLFDAIYTLAVLHDITIVAYTSKEPTEYWDEGRKVRFVFYNERQTLVNQLSTISPDILFLNHHSETYDDLLTTVLPLAKKSALYYSSPIELKFFDLLNFKRHYGLLARPLSPLTKQIDLHLVHHPFQKNTLRRILGIDTNRIFVAPKSANPTVFFPIPMQKKWDVIYPGRSTERYWKRPELAIQATAMLSKTLCMPGAKLNRIYSHVTVPEGWQDATSLNLLYNQSRVLLITSDYREMGPRVIPEAMMCNLPVVCCSDSPACVSHVKKFGGYIAKPNVHDIMKKLLMAGKTYTNTREELIRTDQPHIIEKCLRTILASKI